MEVTQELINKATPIINKIAKQRKDKYAFAYFDSKDIFQEIWLMCLDALKRYRPEFGELENFLNKHVSHRIRNLKRDKYFRPEKDPNLSSRTMNRINIINAIPMGHNDIQNVSNISSNRLSEKNPLDYCISKELEEYILNNIPKEMISHFILLLSGEKIKKRILASLREKILIIVEKYNASQNQ
jgi:hypothetical protein